MKKLRGKRGPYRKRSLLERFEEKYIPEPNSGCWLWTEYLRNGGYGEFLANGKIERAHVFSYKVFVGKIPQGLCVLHKCDTACCVNPNHLELGTRIDNARHRSERDRLSKGENHGNAKLTAEKVAQIRRATGRYVDIAEIFGVTPTAVGAVKRRETWKHVP